MKYQTVELTKLIKIKNGYAFKSIDYAESGHRVIRIANVQNGEIVDKDPKFLPDEIANKFQRYYLKEGAILISLTGNVGRVGVLKKEHEPALLNQRVGEIRIISNKVLPEFIFRILNSPNFEQDAIANSNGIAQLNLSTKWVEKYRIPLPPLSDQARIATLLSNIESLITRRKKSIADLDELLKSTFLEMFGDPVRNDMGWEEKELGDIFSIKHGNAFKSKYFKEIGEYVLLTPGNFYEKGGYRDRGNKQKYYVGKIIDEFVLEKGDMLIAMTEQAPGLLGSPIIVPESNKFLHNQRLGKIQPKINEINFLFLFYLFNSVGVRASIDFSATGLKVRHTSPTKIEKIAIGYPPYKLQTQFAAIVEKIEALKEKYQESLNDLETLYSALSQKAFKGELDLSRIPLTVDLKPKDIITAKPYVGELTLTVQDQPVKGPKTREEILHQLFKTFLSGAKSKSISMDDFWLEAEEKLPDLMDEDAPPLGIADYDQVRDLLFEMLASGKLAQVFNEEENRMEIRAVS
jgi:type I restriction enzyme S subunit